MKTISATEFRHRFGEHLEQLNIEPMLVEKSGRPVAVVLSYRDYEHLQMIEDAYWAQLAKAAEADGFLSAAESAQWIQEKLDETNRSQ